MKRLRGTTPESVLTLTSVLPLTVCFACLHCVKWKTKYTQIYTSPAKIFDTVYSAWLNVFTLEQTRYFPFIDKSSAWLLFWLIIGNVTFPLYSPTCNLQNQEIALKQFSHNNDDPDMHLRSDDNSKPFICLLNKYRVLCSWRINSLDTF